MEGRNYVFFRNADNASYMNMASNFRGINHGTDDKIEVYFESALSTSDHGSYDKIVLSVANEKEKEAMEAIAASLAGSKFDVMRVIADDTDSVYVDTNITAVDSFTFGTAAQTRNTVVASGATVLTASDSGALVVINVNNQTMTLPTGTAGMHFKFVLGVDAEAGCTILADSASGDCFYGNIVVHSTTEANLAAQSVTRAAAIAAPTSNDNLDFVHDTSTLGGTAGDTIECIFDGAAWYVDATLQNDAADPGSIAIINAG